MPAGGREEAFLSAGISSGMALALAQPSEEAGFYLSQEAGSKEHRNKVCGSFQRALLPY